MSQVELPVGVAAYYYAHVIGQESKDYVGLDHVMNSLATFLDKDGNYSQDESTEIVRRAIITVLFGFLASRGYSEEKTADLLEELAMKLRSGQFANDANVFAKELIVRGLMIHKEE